jgi:2-amino-4-hydroxy-6-hydroxymethyldihydropteridine diphosphokinase
MRQERWAPAAVGLGSNLDDPEQQLATALTEIAELPQCHLLAVSPLYRSRPMGPSDQPDFINAAATLITTLSPEALLDRLRDIEDAHGRDRNVERWGPRSLDLDLLLYAHRVIESAPLVVPHAGIAERNFVLVPLAHIAPAWVVPGQGSVRYLLRSLEDPTAGIEILGHSVA